MAQPGDLPALLALEAGFPGDRLSRRQLQRHLQVGDRRLRVALADDGAVVGYALVLLRAGSRRARLYSIVVDPARRGQGIGAALLADAEAIARARGADQLSLEVRSDNPAAIALYRRHGYAEQGRRSGYYDDGADALCMQRQLRP